MGLRLKGQVLKFDVVDKCNRKFASDCEVTFPEKVPVTYNFSLDEIITTDIFFFDDFGIRIEMVYGVKLHSSNLAATMNIFPFVPPSVYPRSVMF